MRQVWRWPMATASLVMAGFNLHGLLDAKNPLLALAAFLAVLINMWAWHKLRPERRRT